ncbi:hypothetical protein MPL1032_240162 [Mesorhizobium plurifarium]|uniref:Uncharacterized protein n=1 Tax=Mesorhizobium plurifarium TaxID=69974 RepID=A0A0K2W176_MESPL|nr:hypothetical protein MPL1032_240162 [Mesorhizobium plurifarium]
MQCQCSAFSDPLRNHHRKNVNRAKTFKHICAVSAPEGRDLLLGVRREKRPRSDVFRTLRQ